MHACMYACMHVCAAAFVRIALIYTSERTADTMR